MRSFVDECRRVGLPVDKLRMLEREVVMDQARTYLYRDANYEAAERTLEGVLAKAPTDFGALRYLLSAQLRLQKCDAAIATATRVLEQDPKEG